MTLFKPSELTSNHSKIKKTYRQNINVSSRLFLGKYNVSRKCRLYMEKDDKSTLYRK